MQLLNNPYALLALFLSPWKAPRTIQQLAAWIEKGQVDGGRLLYLANLHFCGPLWFSRLEEDGLLPLFPVDLQRFLEHLYRANCERQATFRSAVKEIVSALQQVEVPVILLKGAATFVDDLYGAPGARMMGDLDVLVPFRHAERARGALLAAGYVEQEDCFERSPGLFDANAPHHLPRMVKPGTPVVVEIHFQTAQAHGNRVLPTDWSWKNRQAVAWEGLRPHVLNPTCRLLHHTVHALVPHGAYATSILSLGQLAEFAYLIKRHGARVDWRKWLSRGARHGLNRQFRVYLSLANSLMGVPYPASVRPVASAGLHVARICAAASHRADYLTGRSTAKPTLGERVADIASRLHIDLFSRLHMPLWVWRNLCYLPGWRAVPIRLRYFWAYYLWKFRYPGPSALDRFSRRFNKLKSLLKKR